MNIKKEAILIILASSFLAIFSIINNIYTLPIFFLAMDIIAYMGYRNSPTKQKFTLSILYYLFSGGNWISFNGIQY